MNGVAFVQQSFVGSKSLVSGLSQTFNMPSGQNQTVICAPSYFTFTSSDNNIAIVNDMGEITVLAIGTATITASLNGVNATGSLKINAGATFVNALNPILPQANVISIFSDTYTGIAGFDPGKFAGANTSNISTQIFNAPSIP